MNKFNWAQPPAEQLFKEMDCKRHFKCIDHRWRKELPGALSQAKSLTGDNSRSWHSHCHYPSRLFERKNKQQLGWKMLSSYRLVPKYNRARKMQSLPSKCITSGNISWIMHNTTPGPNYCMERVQNPNRPVGVEPWGKHTGWCLSKSHWMCLDQKGKSTSPSKGTAFAQPTPPHPVPISMSDIVALLENNVVCVLTKHAKDKRLFP